MQGRRVYPLVFFMLSLIGLTGANERPYAVLLNQNLGKTCDRVKREDVLNAGVSDEA